MEMSLGELPWKSFDSGNSSTKTKTKIKFY